MFDVRCCALVVLLLTQAAWASHGVPRSGGKLRPKRVSPNDTYYELNVTLSRGAPSCGQRRPIILINGLFMPSLEVTANTILQIQLNNNLPADFPQTSSGISIHFHGFNMWNNNRYYDGAAYISQCPVAPGESFTYSFTVDEAPGTYFWHDHSTMNRADGLMGPLIVKPAIPAPPSPFPEPHQAYVMMLSDWWETEANVLGMQLNRPFHNDTATNNTGQFTWVGNAQTILINGRGNIKDCNTSLLNNGTGYSFKKPFFSPVCNVTSFTTSATHNTSGCEHEEFVVTYNNTYEFKIINAGSLHYFTVCFEGHDLTVVAADAVPVSRFVIEANPHACIDVNNGQRYDVQLTANNNTMANSFWISVHGQTRLAVPSGYAVMRYRGTPRRLPPTPTPQNDMNPWDPEQQMMIKVDGNITTFKTDQDHVAYWGQFLHNRSYDSPQLYSASADKMFVLNTTQPVIKPTGALKWALNNVASSTTPPCAAALAQVINDPNYFIQNSVQPGQEDGDTTRFLSAYKVDKTDLPGVYLTMPDGSASAQAVPTFPQAGQHVIQLDYNDRVDIVLNNLPANDHNGDYIDALRNTSEHRNGSEQHPFHMHGHKFWVLGYGNGVYNPAVDAYKLNTINPPLRDTVSLPRYGWAYIRFTANNPGVWPLHCHIMWHTFMGQQVYLVEAVDQMLNQTRVHPPPSNMPTCPQNCTNNFAPYTHSLFDQVYPNTTYDKPGNWNLNAQ